MPHRVEQKIYVKRSTAKGFYTVKVSVTQS